jgi:hypothetical protein
MHDEQNVASAAASRGDRDWPEWVRPKVVLVEDRAGAQWRRSAPNSWVMAVSVATTKDVASYAPPTATSDELDRYYGPIKVIGTMRPSGQLDYTINGTPAAD